MVAESQLEIISYLVHESGGEVSVGDLAEQMGWSDGHVSRVVSELESDGYVRTKRDGRQKLVALSEIEPIERLESLLLEYSHVDFPELIAGSGLAVLYYLDEPRTATVLGEVSGVSRATVYKRLNKLQRVGVVGKSGSRYRLNDSFSSLSGIARGLAHHQHRREAERHTSGVRIYWATHDEYLFACDTEFVAEHFHETGPALFAEFGIPLLTRERRHYFRSSRIEKVSAADLVCHALLIDDGARYRTYSLLLIQTERVGHDTVRATAEHYDPEAAVDLRSLVDELIEYLETEGEVTSARLPSWREFENTAADYEIDV